MRNAAGRVLHSNDKYSQNLKVTDGRTKNIMTRLLAAVIEKVFLPDYVDIYCT